MNRRDFLKRAAAVAPVATLAVPMASEDDGIPEVDITPTEPRRFMIPFSELPGPDSEDPDPEPWVNVTLRNDDGDDMHVWARKGWYKRMVAAAQVGA